MWEDGVTVQLPTDAGGCPKIDDALLASECMFGYENGDFMDRPKRPVNEIPTTCGRGALTDEKATSPPVSQDPYSMSSAFKLYGAKPKGAEELTDLDTWLASDELKRRLDEAAKAAHRYLRIKHTLEPARHGEKGWEDEDEGEDDGEEEDGEEEDWEYEEENFGDFDEGTEQTVGNRGGDVEQEQKQEVGVDSDGEVGTAI